MTPRPSPQTDLSIEDYTRLAGALHAQMRAATEGATVTAEYTEVGGVSIHYDWAHTPAGHPLLVQIVSDSHRTRVKLQVGNGRSTTNGGIVSYWDVFRATSDRHSPLRALGVRNLPSDGIDTGQPFPLRLDLPDIDAEATLAPTLTADILRQVQWWSAHQLSARK